MSRYESTWWSVQMPAGWSGAEDAGCHTITPADGVGAFQVSAYQKDEDVTDADLRGFAGDIPLHPVATGGATGFTTRFSDGDMYWMKWWLRAGHTMVHATYNCLLPEKSAQEEHAVTQMVQSIAIVPL